MAEANGTNGFHRAGDFASAFRAAADGKAKAQPTPAPIPPYRAFPVDALPLPVSWYVDQAAAALGCDPVYLALPCLAACAGAIGNSRAVRLKADWTEPCVVWSVVIGESGTIKTPAWKKAVGPIFAAQHRLADEHRKALADLDEAAVRPALPRVVSSDVTIEKLVELLTDNPRGLLVTRDELAAWLGSFKRYKGGANTSDLPNWLELFGAGQLAVDRKTGERRFYSVQNAAASVTGTIQPGTLADHLTRQHYESGLAARLLLAWPPRLAKVWTDAETGRGVREGYEAILGKLLGLAMRPDPDREDGPPLPHYLPLDADAREVWVAFFNEWAQEQAAAEGEVASALAKLEGYAARLALLHHVTTMAFLDSDTLRPVGRASMEAGVRLVRWFAAEARRCYVTLAETDDQRQVRRLVEWVRSRGARVTARDLCRSNAGRYPTVTAAEQTLESLAAAGLGRWLPPASGTQGGRPARVFELLPEEQPDTSDNPTKTDTT